MYQLILSDDQAKIVSIACEFFARVKLGQFNRIVDQTLDFGLPCDEYCEKRDKAEEKLLEARKYIYPELNGIGHSYGIAKFEDADMAFGVHQVLRHKMGDERPPFSFRPLPKCYKIQENENPETLKQQVMALKNPYDSIDSNEAFSGFETAKCQIMRILENK